MTAYFSNKTALVTGTTRGIGRAIAVALLDRGARVVGVYKDSVKQAEDLKRTYDKFLPVQFDLANIGGIADMVSSIPPAYASIDILINNAGIKHRMPFTQTTPRIWEESMAVNLAAPYFLTQAVASGMAERQYGRIINISSQAAPNLSIDTFEYGLSKSGLDHLPN